MRTRKKYVAVGQAVVASIFLQMVVCCAFCQCPTATAIYKQVVAIENDTVDRPVKFKKVLHLKKQFEDCKLEKDSVYARLLHRVGDLEDYADGKPAMSAINNTLEAARINLTSRKGSRKYVVNSYFNAGFFYLDLKYYDQAIMYFDSAIYYNQNYADQKKLTMNALAMEAYLNAQKRDYQKCIEICTKGIEVAIALNDTSNLIGLYYYRAKEYIDQGIWQLAIKDIDIGLFYSTLVQSNYFLTTFTKFKAQYYAGQKDYANAEVNFEKAIQLRTKGGTGLDDLKSDYIDYGNYFLNDKQNFTKAIQQYKRAFKLCKPGQDNETLAQVYTSMGQANFRFNHLMEAQDLYQKAFAMLNVAAPADFLQNASSNKLSAVYNNDILVTLLTNKIEILLALYKQFGAKKYLDACLRTALVMESVITQARHGMVGEQSKLFWRNKTRQLFSDAMEACYQAQDTAKALFFMEKSRAVLLSDKLNELGAAAHLPPAAAAKEQSLQLKLLNAQQQLAVLLPSSKQYKAGYIEYLNAKDTLDHFIKSLEHQFPAYYQYKYADAVPSLASLKQYLATNRQSFVHYFLDDTVMYILGITPQHTFFRKLTVNDFNPRRLSCFLSLCSDAALLNRHPDSFAYLAHHIYNKLLEPLHLQAGNVAICTDNFLIPFEALCTDANGNDFLLYRYNFNYVYSARSLMNQAKKRAAPGSDFIGFAPVSFKADLQLESSRQSEDSLAKAAGFYKRHTIFTNAQASRRNFFKYANQYAVITIFSHAQVDTSGREPVLYMQDAAIRLSELQLLRNPVAQFVVLSACQTNAGKVANGEGIYSLARGFAAAGIPSVAGTLWKADDKTVYSISQKFNEYLSNGLNKSEALRQAKIWFIQNASIKKYRLPYYWANMVLVGDAQPLVLAKPKYTWLWIVLISIISIDMLINIVALIYKRRHTFRSSNAAGVSQT